MFVISCYSMDGLGMQMTGLNAAYFPENREKSVVADMRQLFIPSHGKGFAQGVGDAMNQQHGWCGFPLCDALEHGRRYVYLGGQLSIRFVSFQAPLDHCPQSLKAFPIV
jgi:hypothetical protein